MAELIEATFLIKNMIKQDIINSEKTYVAQTYGRPEVVFSHGLGSYLFDTEGNKYLDMVAGIAVNALGHSDPEWVQAVTEQAGKLVHVSNLYHTEPHGKLARRLVEHSFADKVYFCNSGAEANEAAIKFSRKYGRIFGGESKTKIVSFSGAFHGRTMGALAITPREKYQKPFMPLMPDTALGVFNDLASATELIDVDTCAVFIEPIQGEGGILPVTHEFLAHVRKLCNQFNAILVYDEVQCGIGRTGYLFAHQFYGIEPDICSLAKPLAGGLPIGGTLLSKKVHDVIEAGDHGSTFAGGALVCAAANVVFDRVSDPDFLDDVVTKGNYIMAKLAEQLPSGHVVEIRGRGLMVGIEFDHPVGDIVTKARGNGLLLVGAGPNVIRLVPPLTISYEELDEAVEKLIASL